MQIIYKNVYDLNPYKNNPRFNDEAIEMVAKSIQEFGFKVPITIDKDGVIVTGHTRHKAAIALGIKEVPCIILDDLTDDQVKAFRLVDNRTSELAKWDYKALAIELQEIQLDMTPFQIQVEEVSEEIEEDDYEVNVPTQPRSRLGEVYQLGPHRVMCGDATNQEHIDILMNGKTADLLLTDPPYNVDYEGGSGLQIMNDHMTTSMFEKFLADSFIAANAALKPGGAFYIWHADNFSYTFRSAALQAGWQIRQCLVWKKSSLVMGRQDYQWIHEPCLYGWKEGAAHYFIADRGFTTVFEETPINISKLKLKEAKELIRRLMEPDLPTTVIEENKPSKNESHPTMKPVRLFGRLINNSSKKNELVLDPFGGSGTAVIAAEKLKRVCYTMDLDPRYVDVIIDRYEALTGIKAEKVR